MAFLLTIVAKIVTRGDHPASTINRRSLANHFSLLVHHII